MITLPLRNFSSLMIVKVLPSKERDHFVKKGVDLRNFIISSLAFIKFSFRVLSYCSRVKTRNLQSELDLMVDFLFAFGFVNAISPNISPCPSVEATLTTNGPLMTSFALRSLTIYSFSSSIEMLSLVFFLFSCSLSTVSRLAPGTFWLLFIIITDCFLADASELYIEFKP